MGGSCVVVAHTHTGAGADHYLGDEDDVKAGYRDAVVASMVRIHRSVGAVSERAGRRTGRRRFVSPRDFLDLVKHFTTLVSAAVWWRVFDFLQQR